MVTIHLCEIAFNNDCHSFLG
uniref:Uncharacterized protein n=1 Tax=Anguilla anguilla TaxID=7936 RepID=A0A0E9SQ75_ANGAN